MYCPKCGTFLPEGTAVCPNCAEPSAAEANSTNNETGYNCSGNYSAGYQNSDQTANTNYNQQSYNSYYDPQPNAQSYYPPNNNNTYQYNFSELEAKDKLSTAHTLGVLAIILGIIFSPIVGIICGIIGINNVNNVPDMYNNPAIMEDKRKAKKLNVIGIALPIGLWAVAIILILIFAMIVGVAGIASY